MIRFPYVQSLSGNLSMESPDQVLSKEAMHTRDIQALRGELNNLNISGRSVIKIEHNADLIPSEEQDIVILDIADWEHVRPLFQHITNPTPPIFRDPMYQQAPMFVKRLEDFFKTKRIPEQHYLTVVKSVFRGPSENWREFHQSKWKSYSEFRRFFLSTFWSEHEQLKERQRIRDKVYTPRNDYACNFLRMLTKYRFFNPQLSEVEILDEILSKYPPEIQSQWPVRTCKTITSALSFLQGYDASGGTRFTIPDEAQRIQGLNHKMHTLDILDNEVTVKSEMNNSSASSSGQNASSSEITQPQQATFIFDTKLSPPIFVKGQHPVRFLKSLHEYFSICPVEDKLTVVKRSLNSVNNWKKKNQYHWKCFEDFSQQFLSTFWSQERQASEWYQLSSLKFVPEPTNDMADFFISMANRYRLFDPPMPEDTILTTIMGKYPTEIQSLWAASGCSTLLDTVSFLQSQDEVGIMNILANNNWNLNETQSSCTDIANGLASNATQMIHVQGLNRQLNSLCISETPEAPNNGVKIENNVLDLSMSKNDQQQQNCIEIRLKVSPPIFKDKYTQNAPQFMKRLLEYFSLAQIPDEQHLNVVKTLLQDKISEWKDFHEANWTCYADFRRDFYTSFWSQHKQNLTREKLKQRKFVPGRKNETLTRFFLNQVRAYRLFDPPVRDKDILYEIMLQFPPEIMSAYRAEARKTLDTAFLFLEKQEYLVYNQHLRARVEVPRRSVVLSSPYQLPKTKNSSNNQPSRIGKFRAPHYH